MRKIIKRIIKVLALTIGRRNIAIKMVKVVLR